MKQRIDCHMSTHVAVDSFGDDLLGQKRRLMAATQDETEKQRRT